MKKIALFSIIIFALIVSIGCVDTEKEGVNALLLVSRNYGLNYFLMRDNFDEYGWDVIHTAVLDTVPPCTFWGRHPGALHAIPDMYISEIADIDNYDCLIIPTSPGNAWKVPNSYEDLIDSPDALKLINEAVHSNLPVFAMCSGVRVLAAANVISKRHVVGSPRFKEEYEEAGAIYVGNERNDTPPLIDDNIITSARGQTYNYANAMAVATVIERRQKKTLKNVLYIYKK